MVSIEGICRLTANGVVLLIVNVLHDLARIP